MFDLNTVLSAALQQAVEAATKPLLVRINALENAQPGQGWVDTLLDRVALLEMNQSAYALRLTALENNPAQGADTTLVRDLRTAMLGMLKDDADIYGVLRDVAMEAARFAAEEAVDDHCQNYDHDAYDGLESMIQEMGDIDDLVKRDELRSEIQDVMDSATLTLRF